MATATPKATAEPLQSFADATTWSRVSEDRFLGQIGTDWEQGRAAYGGIVAAGMARAMRGIAPADMALRSLSVTFAGPVAAGPVNCATTVIRKGRTAAFLEAKVDQEGSVRTTASATYGRVRPSKLRVGGPSRPVAPAPETLEPKPYIEGIVPRFTQRMDFRWAEGRYPYAGVDELVIGGWFRFRHDSDPADDAGILGLLDGWPAPALSMLMVPAPASSITWDIDFFTNRPDCRIDQWWYFEGATTFAGDGYTSFDASLWAPDGQYVARSRQLVGVFEPSVSP